MLIPIFQLKKTNNNYLNYHPMYIEPGLEELVENLLGSVKPNMNDDGYRIFKTYKR